MSTKFSLLLLTAAIMTSCGNSSTSSNNVDDSQLLGNWQEVMPEGNQFVQGFELQENGNASSFGMLSLEYQKWQILHEKAGDKIILSGISSESGSDINFADTLDIVSLKNDTLTLSKGPDFQFQYVKKDNISPDKANNGQAFSQMLNKNIDLAKDCISVSPTSKDAKRTGYILFAPDSSKVELFLPELNVVLDKRTGANNAPVWNIEDDDTFVVQKTNGKWTVSRRAFVLYTSQATN